MNFKSLLFGLRRALAFGALLHASGNATPTGHRRTDARIISRQPTPACSDGATVENLWVLDQLNVTYADSTATWRLANTMTSTTEIIRCNLRASYICELNGTPGDPSLHVWLQINLDVARISINQSLPCGDAGDPMSAYAIGTAELYLTCNGASSEDELSCQSDDSDGAYYADGSVTVVPGA